MDQPSLMEKGKRLATYDLTAIGRSSRVVESARSGQGRHRHHNMAVRACWLDVEPSRSLVVLLAGCQPRTGVDRDKQPWAGRDMRGVPYFNASRWVVYWEI